MNNLAATLLVCTVLLVLLPTETYAFGAGDIPDFAFLNGKAFRHGDIEGVLAELAKTAGHAAGSGGILAIAQSVLSAATGGAKFGSQDVKRVYFGNWLRDYSQAMDIAGLSKLSADTLVLIVSILGFLTFGFATEEYQVTAQRLGVYLPVEHIDNPKGYAEKEGDARQFHRLLRPPVNPEELEIDERNGMKNYMASEGREWDTSTAHIRRTFRACIEYGRRARGKDGADLWEAFMLLGTGLHTMEDLLAHSNWCELALRKMGHEEVFCFVGDDVIINTPNGPAPPLITGTFGSADFLHSLMGEATDHLSQASVVDLSKRLQGASQNQADTSVIRNLLAKLPIGGGGNTDEKMSQADLLKQKSQAYHFDPDNIAPPEVQQQLWELLKWRDGVVRDIVETIEMVPGLSSLIDSLTNAINAFVYTLLAPYLTPIVQQVTDALGEGSKAVIDSEDQYEVFDNPNASDPSHSLLSKDHFSLILNEPAGKIAQVVVRYSVNLIVNAWGNQGENPDRVIDQILEAFHHPYFNVGRSRIQADMFREMEQWFNGVEDPETTLESLTKESVRAGKNKREGADDDLAQSDQIYGGSHGAPQSGGYDSQASAGGYAQQQTGYGRQQSSYETQPARVAESGYGESEYGSQRRQQGRQDYASSETRYGRSGDEDRQTSTYESEGRQQYGSGRQGYDASESGYNRPSEEYEGSGRGSGRTGGYQSSNRYGEESTGETYGRTEEPQFGSRHTQMSYSSETYRDPDTYGESRQTRSGSGYNQEASSYTRQQPRRDEEDSGYTPSYQPSYESSQPARRYGEDEYGSSRRQEGGEAQYGSSDYSSSNRYAQDEPPSMFVRTEQPSFTQSGGYEGESGYNSSSRMGGYGEESEGYGRQQQSSYRGGGDEYSSRRGGYGEESYGQTERSNDYGETFGTERLNINEDEQEQPHHGRHHRHHDDD